MNWDRIELNWKKYGPRVTEKWEQLNASDIDSIAGQRDRLAACLAARYAISREEAESEIEAWRREVRLPSA